MLEVSVFAFRFYQPLAQWLLRHVSRRSTPRKPSVHNCIKKGYVAPVPPFSLGRQPITVVPESFGYLFFLSCLNYPLKLLSCFNPPGSAVGTYFTFVPHGSSQEFDLFVILLCPLKPFSELLLPQPFAVLSCATKESISSVLHLVCSYRSTANVSTSITVFFPMPKA